uniref:Beta-galactosidase n=1 Tax=Trichobilharzia regenti TaxID=157069 RepID=A0AA85K7A8_TRIRE|nr:unnamed protein product [Trichobilharzia regenti]
MPLPLIFVLLVFSLCHCSKLNSQHFNSERSFTIDYGNHVFMKDGAPFQYISGSVHYSRIPKIYWHDRLYKMKASGLDAIQIYVPWNFHQPEEDIFDFTGDRNLTEFISLASSLDLLVIARVGPYICAEWDFGGLPAWLLRVNPLMKIRSSDPEYMKYVRQWFNVLLPSIKPLLYENVGPIIMVQLENEYGSYINCDQKYMTELYDLGRSLLGENILIFTTDGADLQLLKCGSSDKRYLATIDFGPTTIPVPKAFEPLEMFRANQPWVNSEYYVGWLDVWNGIHNRVDPIRAATALNHLISYSERVNVNIYMFHGGTNFGFWNGGARPRSSITSYDYDAPISESGDITWKYMVFRELLFKRKGIKPPQLPQNTTKKAYGKVKMMLKSHLLTNKGPVTHANFPVHMERLRQYNGYMIYSVPLTIDKPEKLFLDFFRISDIAHIFTGDKSGRYTYYGSLEYKDKVFKMDNIHDVQNLTIIAENAGHVNYGFEMIYDKKGIIGPVFLNSKVLDVWEMIPIKDPFSLDYVYQNEGTLVESEWPVPGRIYHGTFTVDELGDTFIHPDSFSRGIISVNGFHIGRFDQIQGPQLRLYVPKSFLKLGENQLVITILQGPVKRFGEQQVEVSFHDSMLWSK